MHYIIVLYIIIIILVAACVSLQKPQEIQAPMDDLIFVYQEGKQVATLLNNNLEDCYTYESMEIFNKQYPEKEIKEGQKSWNSYL